jgi:hypothetical protein
MMTQLTAAKVLGVASAGFLAEGIYFAMTDAVVISAISSVAAVVMAAVSAYFAYKAKVTAVETHGIVNSRMTEFMEMARRFYFGQGKLEEKADEKARQALKAEGVLSEKTHQQKQTDAALPVSTP